MADESVDSILLLNDLLCYVRNMFDRVPIKALKCSIVDFSTVDVIVDAKVRLLYDIEAMKSSNLRDQFAYRLSGSTTSALVSLTDTIGRLLEVNNYVINFSKA